MYSLYYIVLAYILIVFCVVLKIGKGGGKLSIKLMKMSALEDLVPGSQAYGLCTVNHRRQCFSLKPCT